MTGGKKDRNRASLSQEDQALWEKVKQSAKPLHRPALEIKAGPVSDPDAKAQGAVKSAKTKPSKIQPPKTQQQRLAPSIPAKAPGLNSLDRRTVQRIARGSTDIDARIDLHGMTQRSAHGQLLRFLAASQARGHKVVLVITGKGSQGSDDAGFFREVGVLRRAVPLWLQEPGFRNLVVGYERAHKSHGGEGALYIRLRRRHADGGR